jgi:putative PIN family toxin of toxin-antitoxin system
MPLRIVLDTNVLISAIGWDGPERETIRKAINGDYTIIISQNILNEFFGVISRDKFSFIKRADIGRFLMIIIEIFEIVETKTKVHLIEDDPDDNMVIECAIDGEADMIISGDVHLLRLGEVGNIKIISSRELIAYLEQNQGN